MAGRSSHNLGAKQRPSLVISHHHIFPYLLDVALCFFVLLSWDPFNGIRLKWGPGHRWIGQVELPLGAAGVGNNAPLELKLAVVPLCPSDNNSGDHHEGGGGSVCCPSGGSPAWEPGGNRAVDLWRVVADGSPTGAGEVHLTCTWGAGPATAVSSYPFPLMCAGERGSEGVKRTAEIV